MIKDEYKKKYLMTWLISTCFRHITIFLHKTLFFFWKKMWKSKIWQANRLSSVKAHLYLAPFAINARIFFLPSCILVFLRKFNFLQGLNFWWHLGIVVSPEKKYVERNNKYAGIGKNRGWGVVFECFLVSGIIGRNISKNRIPRIFFHDFLSILV